MQTRFGTGPAVALLVTAMGSCAHGQTVPPQTGNASRAEVPVTSSAPDTAISSSAMGQLWRVIDDPHTGARWLLVRDGIHPAGPGRLILLAGAGSQHSQDGAETVYPSYATQFGAVSLRPVIRTGDRLVVEENTAVAEVRLEAVALGPAGVGSELKVRLKISDKVLRAKALGAGRAEFLAAGEVRR